MTELSRGKSLVVLAIVVGCFAILWPKIFYPMFQGSVAPTTTTTTTTPPPARPPFREREPGTLCCGLVFENDVTSAAFLAELCSAVLKRQPSEQQVNTPPELLAIHLTDPVFNECRRDLLEKCGIDLDDIVKSDVDGAVVDRRLANKFHGKVRAKNLTTCLLANYDIDENLVRAKKSYHRPQDVFYPRHMRPERPPHLHPDGVHPALREKGRVIPPTRTIEKQAKPGPMPGMRPPMGAGGHVVSPPSGTGSMGILMPIYTIGIVVFFCYTLMKIFFKKQQPESTEPRIKDFHMDPEHRKYLFSEDYCTVPGPDGRATDIRVKEYALLQEQQRLLLLEQQLRRSRSRTPPESLANKEERVEDLQTILEHVCTHREEVAVDSKTVETAHTDLTREAVDADGVAEEPAAKAEAQPVEAQTVDEQVEEAKEEGNAGESHTKKATIPDDLPEADERLLRLAYAALKAQKDEEVDQLRRRLEETEKAMERICRQMGNVTDKLLPTAVAELFTSQLQEAEKQEAQVSVVEDSVPTSEVSEESTVQEVKPQDQLKEEELKSDSAMVDESSASKDVEQAHEDAKEPEQVVEEQFVDEIKPTSFAEMVAKAQDEEPVVEQTPIPSTVVELESSPSSQPLAAEPVSDVAQEETQPKPAPEELTIEPETKQEGAVSFDEPQPVTDEQAIAECLMEDHVKPTSFADMIAKVHEDEPAVVEEVHSSSVAQLESSQPEPTVEEGVVEEVAEPVVEEIQASVVQFESSQPEPSVEGQVAEEAAQPVVEEIQSSAAQFESSQPEPTAYEQVAEQADQFSVDEAQSSVAQSESSQPEPSVEEHVVEEAVQPVVDEIQSSAAQFESSQHDESTVSEQAVEDAAEPAVQEAQSNATELESIQTESVVVEQIVDAVDEPVVEVTSVVTEEPIKPSEEQQLATDEVHEKEPAVNESLSAPLESSQHEQPSSFVENEQTQYESTVLEETEVNEVSSSENVADEEFSKPAEETEADLVQPDPTTVEEATTEVTVTKPAEVVIDSTAADTESVETVQAQLEETLASDDYSQVEKEESATVEASSESVSDANVVGMQAASDEESQLESMLQAEALKVIESIEECIIPKVEEVIPTEQVAEDGVVQEIIEKESAIAVEASQPEKVEETVSGDVEVHSAQLNVASEGEVSKVTESIEECTVSAAEESAPAEQETVVAEEKVEVESVQQLEASQPEKQENAVSEAVEETSQLVYEEEALKVIENVEECIIPDAGETVPAEQQVDSSEQSVEAGPVEDEAQALGPEKVEESVADVASENQPSGEAQEYNNAVSDAVPESQPVENVQEPEALVSEERVAGDSTEESQTTVEDTTEKVEEHVPEAPVHPEVVRCALYDQQRPGSEERKLMVSGIEVVTEMEDHGKMPAELLPRVTPDRHHPKAEAEPHEPVPSVLLETTIPPESHLVVSEAECSAEVVPPEQLDLDETEYESSPVVLSGKMTLSVIGMELTAEAPDVHPETYIVDEPDSHRSVRFPEQPTDKVYLIPSEPEEESSEATEEVSRAAEEDDEKLEEPLEEKIIYRPPTPPLHHIDDEEQPTEEVEFLTYEQLEEAGEIGIEETEAVQEEIQQQYEAVTSFTSAAQPFYVDSGLEPVEEEPELVEDEKPEIAEGTVQAATEEHESIVQMAQQIRDAEQAATNDLPASAETEAVNESPADESTAAESLQNESLITESVDREPVEVIENHVDSAETVSTVAEPLAVECDTETMTAEPPVTTLSQAVENADVVSQSLADRVLMDVEYQVLPTSESSSSVGTIQSSESAQETAKIEEDDFERNRELPEIEHSLEQIEATASESEPSISNFIIREDYPEDEATQAMTEEEILQARREIEAIKKLLADVTSNVTEGDESAAAAATATTSGDQSSVANELAHAMAEEGAPSATSKGSSPDMDEFEVIRSSESTAIETLDSKLPSTSES